MELFGISLVAGLDKTLSRETLNSEITKLQGQLKNLKINIDIDPKALNTIKSFTIEIQKLNANANTLNIGKAFKVAGNESTEAMRKITVAMQGAQKIQQQIAKGAIDANKRELKSLEQLLVGYKNIDKVQANRDKNGKISGYTYQVSNDEGQKRTIKADKDNNVLNSKEIESERKHNAELQKIANERQKIINKLSNIENKYGSSKTLSGLFDTANNADIQKLRTMSGEIDKFGQSLASTAKRDDAKKLADSLSTLTSSGAYKNSVDNSVVGKLQRELADSKTSVHRIGEINKELTSLKNNLKPREQAIVNLNGIDQEIRKTRELSDLQQRLNVLKDRAVNAKGTNAVNNVQNDIKALQNEINKRKEVIATVKQQEAAEHKLAMAQLEAQRKVSALMGSLSGKAQRGQAGKEIEAWHNQVRQISTTTPNFSRELDTLNKKFSVLSTEIRNNDGAFAKFEGQFGAAMLRIPIYAAGVATMYAPLIALKDALKQIIEIDTQMTVLERVSNGQININKAMEDSITIAEKLGNTIAQVNDGMINFSRQGFRGDSLTEMAETAVLMGNISDLNVDEAASSLTAAMKGFNIEASESIKIVDALNEVDKYLSLIIAIL